MPVERAVLRPADAHRAAQPRRVGPREPEAHRAALVVIQRRAHRDDPDSTSLALYVLSASLIYMDGTGAMYLGTSGEQAFSVAKSGDRLPC